MLLNEVVFLSLGVCGWIVSLCSGCVGCCAFCLICDACTLVSSCRCCVLVSCVHPVAIVRTFSMLIVLHALVAARSMCLL